MKYQRIECEKVMIDGKEFVPIKASNSLTPCDGCVAGSTDVPGWDLCARLRPVIPNSCGRASIWVTLNQFATERIKGNAK